jgi:hypothetical protein
MPENLKNTLSKIIFEIINNIEEDKNRPGIFYLKTESIKKINRILHENLRESKYKHLYQLIDDYHEIFSYYGINYAWTVTYLNKKLVGRIGNYTDSIGLIPVNMII